MLGFFKKTQQAVRRTRDSWFGKVTRLFEREAIGESLWEELEELLISADVGAETTDKLVSSVKERAQKDKLHDAAAVQEALKEEMVCILSIPKQVTEQAGGIRIIMVVGVNGSGKTTSIAKLAKFHKSQGKKVLLVAADTFRAAAVEQLQIWAERDGVDIISSKPGSDPGAVVFDALQAAASRKADIIIIDTAGRLHTKFNLMEELKKIKRIAARESKAPLEVLLVLDATTGQNGLAQAKHFTDAVEVSGIFLSKLDGTAKGGVVLAICDQLKLPLSYIGTGEGPDDMVPFNPVEFVEALFASDARAESPALEST
ncbi:MAG: signal recognition particle-docking protein FtsY [Chloroflexi bacterium]|nr:signal recognition particle-docking protein FtsY [Chloroflexota bacterium]